MSTAHASSEAAYPPYASRPGGGLSSAGHTGQSETPFRAPSAVEGSGVGRGTRQTDGLMSHGDGIELTNEEKQEGYDVDLLNLPERNTAAQQAAPPRASSPPVPTGASVVAANLPYASRVREESFDSKKRHSSSVAKDRLGVRHHSTATGDHHRSSGRAHGQKDSSGARRRSSRRKKKLAWYQKPRFLIALLVLVVIVGLAVGLSVGLTQGKSSSSSASSGMPTPTASTREGDGGVSPSTSGSGGGVQVSASGADAGGAETVQPVGVRTTATPDSAEDVAVRVTPAAVSGRKRAMSRR
ncbi:hypothetical protein JCM10213_006731 [Rhodosporidiobolus nylandii]